MARMFKDHEEVRKFHRRTLRKLSQPYNTYLYSWMNATNDADRARAVLVYEETMNEVFDPTFILSMYEEVILKRRENAEEE